MEQNTENANTLGGMTREYLSLRGVPTDQSLLDLAMSNLIQHYLKSCKSLDAAKAVHKRIMMREEWFPAPAVIHKYLNELQLVDLMEMEVE